MKRMKFNLKNLWKLLQLWIDFEEGETGDCPEMDELLRKIVEHEKGFEKELREMILDELAINPSGRSKLTKTLKEILGE